MRFGLLPVILIAGGAALSAVSQQFVPVERPAAAQIDFDGLHLRAAVALDTLRQSRQSRIAAAVTF